MRKCLSSICLVVILLLVVEQSTCAFSTSFATTTSNRQTTTTTCLWGRKKKGSLFDIDVSVEGEKTMLSPKKMKSKKETLNKKKTKTTETGISSDLASFFSSQPSSTTEQTSATTQRSDSTVDEDIRSASFTQFIDEDDDEEALSTTNQKRKKGKNKKQLSTRRMKQSERMAQDSERNNKVKQITNELENLFENENDDKKESKKKTTIEDILKIVNQLLSIDDNEASTTYTNLRSIASPSTEDSYRLAWVGSDESICHIGTGLHKVPLARLQEIFLQFKKGGTATNRGDRRVELYEVIRVLGPFPNVRNTLQGGISNIGKVNNNSSPTILSITLDSMIDGTGKEILAGTEKRKVDLHIYFADENAIVAVVPPSEDDLNDVRSSPIDEDNGKNVLVFIREGDLQAKLKTLRVD